MSQSPPPSPPSTTPPPAAPKTEAPPPVRKVHALIATIPGRRASCEALLGSLPAQTLVPDVVELVLDGYGVMPAPVPPMAHRLHRSDKALGPGGRWRVAREVPPETILVVIDDDIVIALSPRFIETMVQAVERGGAAAAIGIGLTGLPVAQTSLETDELICGSAQAMALRAGDLEGIDALRDKIHAECNGLDVLGYEGDDEALVSALLWQRKVPIVHVGVPSLRNYGGTQDDSQARRRLTSGEPFWRQRHEISRVTGWPWPLKN